MALYATIYLALMGKEGMKEVNRLSCDGAHYLYNKLIATGKFSKRSPASHSSRSSRSARSSAWQR